MPTTTWEWYLPWICPIIFVQFISGKSRTVFRCTFDLFWAILHLCFLLLLRFRSIECISRNISDVCRDQNMHLVKWLGYQRLKSRESVSRCAVFRKPLTFDHVAVHKKPTPDWVYFANTEGYVHIVSPKVAERLSDHRHMDWRENKRASDPGDARLSWNLCHFYNESKFENFISVLLCRWGLLNSATDLSCASTDSMHELHQRHCV